MLEQMRRSSQSLLIYVLFGIVIAVFIISFGPQSRGATCEGSGTDSGYAAKVGRSVLSPAAYRYAFLLSGGPQYPAQLAKQRRLKETIMDKLIERELLAEEGTRLGFSVSQEEVEDFLAESKIIGMGYEQTIPSVQKDGHFDYDLFKKFVQFQLGLTPKTFIEDQRREMLALRVHQMVRGGVAASAQEVKEDFERRGNQVNLEYVRFSSRRYDAEVEPADAEIASYAVANEKKLKETYDQRKFLYEKAPRERKLRQLRVLVDAGASSEGDAAAKKKAELFAARIRKGETFAAVARTGSDDTRTKARGGDLGWRRQGATTLGAAIEDKVWAAKDGELVGPLKGSDGWYLVVAEGSREGDLPFDKVKLELAENELRQEKAKARAKADADAALAKARGAVEKTLKDLFPDPTLGAEGAAKAGSKSASKAGTPVPADAPRAEETGLFSQRGSVVEGIGTSPELAKAAFMLKAQSPLAGPFEVSGSYLIVRMKERKEADMAEFEKKKIELLAEAANSKGEAVAEELAMQLCRDARQAKRIEVNRQVLRYEDSAADPSYEPCSPRP